MKAWIRVLLFAILTGLYTGLVMLVPALQGTSFQDIGICYEWWILFAVLVVTKCDKAWKAALQCFVFFLVSQPVVYLVEVVGGKVTMEKALYYYRTIWFPMTLLTLPGGFIAYFSKKENVFGAGVLGIGEAMLLLEAVNHIGCGVLQFPWHLLSGVAALGIIVYFTLAIQKRWKYRAVSLSVMTVLTGTCLWYVFSNGLEIFVGA